MDPPPKPAPPLPKLAILPRPGPDVRPWTFQIPSKKMDRGFDIVHFFSTTAYRDICIFVLQLNRALCPRKKAREPRRSNAGTVFTLLLAREADKDEIRPSVRRLRTLLGRVAAVLDEAPPDPGPRRFGNVAFRTWHGIVAERVNGGLLEEAVGPEVLAFCGGDVAGGVCALDELRAYFLGAFGSAQRLDYGTGHELSFLAFLGGLWKLGAFTDGPESEEAEVERSIVLLVFEDYLQVIRKLILTYTLEPAGSHGVWGLDDYFFLPYIFGSAQLARPIAEDEPMSLSGSVLHAPKPDDVLRPDAVEFQRRLSMYFSAVGFINDVKRGPFWEHSPILFNVSGIKQGWGKINKGMIKMFNADVLCKFPVVQHFPFGSLFSWDVDPDAPVPTRSVQMRSQPIASAATEPVPSTSSTTAMPRPHSNPVGASVGIAAPWAQSVRMPGSTGPTGSGITSFRVPSPDPVARQVVGGRSGDAQEGGWTKAPWA